MYDLGAYVILVVIHKLQFPKCLIRPFKRTMKLDLLLVLRLPRCESHIDPDPRVFYTNSVESAWIGSSQYALIFLPVWLLFFITTNLFTSSY